MSSTVRRLGIVALVAVVIAAGVVMYLTTTREEPPRISALFTDASGVTLGYQVRAGGVDVGKVGDVFVEDGKARLFLDVDPAVLPLHSDASLTIRPANLLGESYLELDAGSPTAPVLDPPVIPEQQNHSSTTLQQVVNTLDDPTSTALASMVTSLGESVQGAGPEAAAAVKALRPALERTDETAAILNKQNAVLNQLVDRTQPVVDSLAGDGGRRLDGLLDTTQTSLRTVAARRQALERTLSELPSTIVQGRRTLSQLAGTADAATPTLKSIRPVTDNLPQIVDELYGLADSADPALASLRPVLGRAEDLLDKAAPVVEELRRAGPDLRKTASGLKPVGTTLLDKDKNLIDLMDFIAQWSLSTNGRDGYSNYFRGLVHASPAALTELVKNVPGLGPTLGSLAGGPAAKAPTGSLPMAGLPAPGRPGVGAPVGSGPAPTRDPENATGLSPGQEQSMVGQLLGGR